MHILIAGGTGFLGQALTKHLLDANYQITILGRSTAYIRQLFPNKINAIDWNVIDSHIAEYDAVINLCGANIGSKIWSKRRKKNLFTSRITPTQILTQACVKHKIRLLNAGGVGIYGIKDNRLNCNLPKACDENQNLATTPESFLQRLSFAWQQATQPALDAQIHVCLLRFGVVLDPNGGALKKLSLPFRLYFGGKIGTGHQAFAWISLRDFCRAMLFILQHPQLNGPINLVAPKCINQLEFAHALSHSLTKPCWFTTPAWVVKMFLGEMAEELILSGQHVIPSRLLEAGFNFLDIEIESALNFCFQSVKIP